MLSFDGSIYIDRPPATVWDVVGTRLFETQPEWEDGIVAIHPLQEGPIGVGSRAIMERVDLGWRRRTNYQCMQFEANRFFVFHNDSPSLHVEFRLSIQPERRKHGTLLRFVVNATVSGFMRFLEPLGQPMLEQARRKTLTDMKEYVERNTRPASSASSTT